MCSAFARHISARDPDGRIRLVASQSEEGRSRYASLGLDADAPATNLFIDRDGRTLTHSDSSLAILREIGHSRALVNSLAMVPRSARDVAYLLVARNRYRLFGRHETCQLITRLDQPVGSLYRRAFGTAFDQAPDVVRDMHAAARAVGEADVVCGPGLMPSIASVIARLPPSGRAVPLSITFERHGNEECWTRSFGGRIMRSRQRLSKRPGRLIEVYGLVRVELSAEIDDQGVVLRPMRAWLAGIPLPRRLVPGGYGRESACDGRYRFDVEVRAFGTSIIRYAGRLVIEPVARS